MIIQGSGLQAGMTSSIKMLRGESRGKRKSTQIVLIKNARFSQILVSVSTEREFRPQVQSLIDFQIQRIARGSFY